MCRGKFLNIKIPNKMIHTKADTSLKWIKILSSIECEDILDWCITKYPSIIFEASFNNFLFSWSYSNRPENWFFKTFKKFLKLRRIVFKESFLKICFKSFVNHLVVIFSLSIQIAFLEYLFLFPFLSSFYECNTHFYEVSFAINLKWHNSSTHIFYLC